MINEKKLKRIQTDLNRYLTDNYDSIEFDDYVNEEDVQFLLDQVRILEIKQTLLTRTLSLTEAILAHLEGDVTNQLRKHINEILNDLK